MKFASRLFDCHARVLEGPSALCSLLPTVSMPILAKYRILGQGCRRKLASDV
jgi:hypothetical protein